MELYAGGIRAGWREEKGAREVVEGEETAGEEGSCMWVWMGMGYSGEPNSSLESGSGEAE